MFLGVYPRFHNKPVPSFCRVAAVGAWARTHPSLDGPGLPFLPFFMAGVGKPPKCEVRPLDFVLRREVAWSRL